MRRPDSHLINNSTITLKRHLILFFAVMLPSDEVETFVLGLPEYARCDALDTLPESDSTQFILAFEAPDKSTLQFLTVKSPAFTDDAPQASMSQNSDAP